MTEAEQIFEKHIGLNTELGYLPYKKKDIINAINEALAIQRVSQQRELLLGFQKSEWFDLYEQGVLEYKEAIEKYLT